MRVRDTRPNRWLVDYNRRQRRYAIANAVAILAMGIASIALTALLMLGGR